MSFSPLSNKEICALHKPKGREEAQQFIAEGLRTVTTLITSGYMPYAVYVTEAYDISSLPASVTPTYVSQQTMDRITASTTASGILAVFPIPANPPATELTSGLVLAQIADPGNMGTLIRSCAAFGYSSVVVVEGCDPFSPKVVQATAGTLAQVKIFQWTWQELLKNKSDFNLCALQAHKGKKPESLDLSSPLLVVGNEANGIPAEWVKTCDSLLSLPTSGEVESLNAAIAGSIALYCCSQKKN